MFVLGGEERRVNGECGGDLIGLVGMYFKRGVISYYFNTSVFEPSQFFTSL